MDDTCTGPAPLHRQRRGRRAPRRGAARAPHRLRPRPAGPGAEGLLGAARAEAADRQSRRKRDRGHGPRRARPRIPGAAGAPSLPRDDGDADAGALCRHRNGLRRRRRPCLDRGERRQGPSAAPSRPARHRPDEGTVADRDPGQAVRDQAARLGGRRSEPSHPRRRRLRRSSPGLPGEEARAQGGHARRRRDQA